MPHGITIPCGKSRHGPVAPRWGSHKKLHVYQPLPFTFCLSGPSMGWVGLDWVELGPVVNFSKNVTEIRSRLSANKWKRSTELVRCGCKMG